MQPGMVVSLAQNEPLEEQLRHVAVVTKSPIDRLYPHSCQNENCKRPLKFDEILVADGNNDLHHKFIKKTRWFIKRNYPQFDKFIREHWSLIFAKYEFHQYLRKLYRNPDIKFFCCSCARKAKDNDWEMIVKEGKVYLEREEKAKIMKKAIMEEQD